MEGVKRCASGVLPVELIEHDKARLGKDGLGMTSASWEGRIWGTWNVEMRIVEMIWNGHVVGKDWCVWWDIVEGEREKNQARTVCSK